MPSLTAQRDSSSSCLLLLQPEFSNIYYAIVGVYAFQRRALKINDYRTMYAKHSLLQFHLPWLATGDIPHTTVLYLLVTLLLPCDALEGKHIQCSQ